MNWPTTWREIFSPKSTHEINVAKLVDALNNPLVRAHWMRAVLDQLVGINLEVDKLLERDELGTRLIEISAKRRQIVAVLEQIEASRNSVELEQSHNQEDLLAV